MTISAKAILHSSAANVPNIFTVQLRYPRFIHAELMTHRVFSRNASSSRAIPVTRLIKDIIDDPVYPMHWGKNQPGMQADEECEEGVLGGYNPYQAPNGPYTLPYYISREAAWDQARNEAIKWAERFEKAGYHKQIVNRLLEPFSHINVVVTSTHWSNWDALRDHRMAQPEIRILAQKIKEVRENSFVQPLEYGQWHLPYIGIDDWNALPTSTDSSSNGLESILKVSTARCARVSYLTHEGRLTTVEEDVRLYERLLSDQPIHASPAEHQAMPDRRSNNSLKGLEWESRHLHGNFNGWIQHRKMLPGECQ